jgi:hypothetical protein
MMKKGNHPLKMYGKSPLKNTGAYRDSKFIGKPEDSGNEQTGNIDKIANKSKDQKTSGVPGVDRPFTFRDYFGGGQNLSETGPFSRLKAKLENKQKVRRNKNLTEYKAEKGEAFNKLVDTGVELPKQDYTLPKEDPKRPHIPENDKSSLKQDYTLPKIDPKLPHIPEIDESSGLNVDVGAFQQVSDGYNRAMMRGKLYQMSAEYKKMKNGK